MKTISYIHILGSCIGLLFCSINTQAEEIVRTTQNISIPLMQKNMHSNMTLPQRGDSANQVENTFGNPIKKHPAKGKPPISKWEYEQFTVYFESNYVIHNVLKNTSSDAISE